MLLDCAAHIPDVVQHIRRQLLQNAKDFLLVILAFRIGQCILKQMNRGYIEQVTQRYQQFNVWDSAGLFDVTEKIDGYITSLRNMTLAPVAILAKCS